MSNTATPFPLTIFVRDEHIARSASRDSQACPIFHALMEQVPGIVDCHVNLWDATIMLRRTDFDSILPPVAIGFINALDAGKPVAPFSFDLAGPVATPQMIAAIETALPLIDDGAKDGALDLLAEMKSQEAERAEAAR